MTRRQKVLSTLAILTAAILSSSAWLLSHNRPCGAEQKMSAGTPSMKAAVYRCYGSPDVVKFEDIAKTVPAEGRVLIRVRAASVNPLDWHYMRGEPYVMRAMVGLGAPKDIRIGVDFAGTVEAIGKNVTRFRPGDAVFGGADGAFAEYVSVRENGALALKPDNLTFEQAAAAPIAAVTALQALRDYGKVQAGQEVLINGASGGVGTFAVQIAKAYGARVTAVCSSRNVDMVRSIGADRVIDYTQEDFTHGQQRYDLIIDTVGTHSFSDYRRVLKPHGALVMVGSQDKGRWLGPMSGSIEALFYRHFVSQEFVFMLANLNQVDLGKLSDLMQAGKVTPVIDRRYPLSEVREALSYLEQGHAQGKVILTLE